MRRASSKLIAVGALAVMTALSLVAPPAALAAPDRVAFVRFKPVTGRASIVTMESSGKKQRTVKQRTATDDGHLFTSAELSPDGKRLAYVQGWEGG